MSTTWMTRTAPIAAATLFALVSACASGTTTSKGSDSKIPVSAGPIYTEIKPLPPDLEGKIGAYTGTDRVALICGFTACFERPWIVTVVDLGTRAVTLRTLANAKELERYLPSPTGAACTGDACPTMAAVMPPTPTLFSGSPIMGGGGGKGAPYTRTSGSLTCPEPQMLVDSDLYDLVLRVVLARNDAAAAVAARTAPAR